MKILSIADIKENPELCIDPVTGLDTATGEQAALETVVETWQGTFWELIDTFPSVPLSRSLYVTNWFLDDDEKQLVACRFIQLLSDNEIIKGYATRILTESKQLTDDEKISLVENTELDQNMRDIIINYRVAKQYKRLLNKMVVNEKFSNEYIYDLIKEVVYGSNY